MSQVTLDKEEYDQIIDELERLSAQDDLDHYDWMLSSPSFWDRFLTKVISNFVSVKVWTLLFALYAPYHLLKIQMITADHYVNIVVIVIPALIGFREYSKAKVDQNTFGSGLIDKVKAMFNI